MKSVLGIAAALSLFAYEASAHYIFQQVSVGSQKYGVFEGVRKNTNYNSPVTGKTECFTIYYGRIDEAPEGGPRH